ncbi:MAG: hypothetical protein ACKO7A_21715 [Microcystis sp.]
MTHDPFHLRWGRKDM